MKKLTHLDLFSGIGGASIAVDEVFGKNNVTHIFCDNEPFAQAILKKHWSEAPIIGDIRTFTANAGSPQFGGLSSGEREALSALGSRRPFILTGGFPCQPFSQAGRRKGTDDDRYLWPEMLRVIREFKPQWVVGENVGGFVTWGEGVVLEQVCLDLEGEGYEVQPFVIPAVAVNAPHRRDRVWIVANRTSARTGSNDKGIRQEPIGNGGGQGADASDANNTRNGASSSRTDKDGSQESGERKLTQHGTGGQGGDASDASDKGLERNERELKTKGCDRQFSGEGSYEGGSWNENWLEVATRLCTVDDGLPDGLVRPKGWRNAALKGAGNAWVPAVAIEILKGIKKIDDRSKAF